MHELAICQAILRQAVAVAAAHGARRVACITLLIGPLAGVEPVLLHAAFPFAAAGTSCEGAQLQIATSAVRVACRTCGAASTVAPNRLLCGACGAWRVDVLAGNELRIQSVDLLEEEIENV